MAFLRCPYCQKAFSSGAWGDPTANWGSPYRSCSHCGKQSVDITRIEPALKELKLPDMSTRHLMYVHFFPYGLIALLCLAGSIRFEPRGLLIACGLVLCVIYAYKIYSDKKNADQLLEKMKRLYQQSRERLQDPVYIRALQALDYQIPQELLDYAAQFPEETQSEDPDRQES